MWIGFIWIRTGNKDRFCEHNNNKPFSSTYGREFFDQLRNY